jgi:citrate lyase beta subunit
MHAKAAASTADVVMLDLEDSVPVDAKKDARRQVIASLQKIAWGKKVLTFRCNALDTPFGYRDLLEVLEGAGDRLDAVVIPKVDHPGDIHFIHRLMAGIEMRIEGRRPVGIEASVETAQGLARIREIAAASDRLVSLVFGIADYQASIGVRLVSVSGHGEAEDTVYPGHRWNFVMSRVVMAAKSRGLLAVDAPYGNFQDPEGLKKWASVAAALGFDGKWAIHPEQVEAINAVFSPSTEEVQRARKILDAFDAAAAKERGAVAVGGRMVDGATVRLARRTWEIALRLGLASEEKGR